MTRTFVVVAVIAALVGTPVDAQQNIREEEAWRALGATLPPGTFVTLRLKDGRRFSGIVVQHQGDTLLFKPKTRIPVPAAEVAFRDIDSIERRTPGLSPGTKVVIGVASTVGAILLAALITLATGLD